MGVRRRTSSYGSEYTVTYSNMHGVDFSSSSSGGKRTGFSRLENMYKDYDGGGAGITESIPGFRQIASLGNKIHSIFSHKSLEGEEFIVVHSGTGLYRFAAKDRDNIGALSPLIRINNGKSCAFCSGSDLYILDGIRLVRIDGSGTASYVNDGAFAPYIPTIYYNGKEYEQRNLLTNKFKESYMTSTSADIVGGSPGLTYRIISTESRFCSVTGISEGHGGAVYIPQLTSICGTVYSVTSIDEKAFYMNESVVSITLPSTVIEIGAYAFYGCKNLTRLVTSGSLQKVGSYVGASCAALERLYLCGALFSIGEGSFTACPKLSEVHTERDLIGFTELFSESTDFSGAEIIPLSRYSAEELEIPIFSPAESVSSVSLEGEEVPFTVKIKNSMIIAVIVNADDVPEGASFLISGSMAASEFTKSSYGTSFLEESGGRISGFDAICGCNVAESFDGRIFLSGNPKLPNTVFYTARDSTGRNNPTYFGILNYFNDGIGSFGIESMLAAGDSLAVFKSGDDGCGSIYYHTPRTTGSDLLPVIYPVSYVHNGIHAIGKSISFFDDPVFLSALGVCALDKRNINSERSISVRSHNINSRLLAESLAETSMTRWCGYLVLAVNGHIYLADSRDTFLHSTGSTEYEWYYLDGIGSRHGDEEVFRYAGAAEPGYSVHPAVDSPVEGRFIYSDVLPDGKTVLYSWENGVKYRIYGVGEKRGGQFYPAVCVYSTLDDLLFFGTASGALCVFNNDRRGAPPLWSSNPTESEKLEYKRLLGRRLHSSYYSFNGHAPRYVLSTVSDNGGFPNLEKSTLKDSVVAKLRLMGSGRIVCEAETEEKCSSEEVSLPSCGIDFGDIDFTSLSFADSEELTVSFKEREKNWIEKRLSFRADSHGAPFGIYSITYRFKTKGKIKN